MIIILQKIFMIFGILVNVIGAWYISRCLIKKTQNEMKSENCFVYSWNDDYVLSAMKQKIEGTVGIVFIVVGSLLQISTIVYDSQIEVLLGMAPGESAIVIIMIIFLLLLLFICFANSIIKHRYQKSVVEYIRRNRQVNDKTHIYDINRYIKYADKTHESINNRTRAIEKFNRVYNLIIGANK